MVSGTLLRAGRRALTVGLLLTITTFAFEALAVAAVMPVTVRDLGGVRLYGWAFSGFMLANLLGITVWGRQSDRRGPAFSFTAGIALFGAGLVIGGLAPTMLVLVGGRVVQGLGAGGMSSAVYVGVGRGYPEEMKPRMLAALSSAWVVPGLAGPAVAGAVAEHLTWRAVFLGLLPLVGLAAALALPALRRLGPAAADGEGLLAPAPERALDALRVAVGAGVFLGGLGNRSPLVGVPLISIGALVATPALRRLLPAGTLRGAAGLPAAVLARGLLTFAFFGTEAFIPLGLTSLRHLSVTLAGLTLTAATLSWTLGAWLQAHRLKEWPRRRTASVGSAVVMLGIAGAAGVILFGAVPVALASGGWALAGLGMGMAFQVGTLVALDESPPQHLGRSTSSVQLADTLGIAVGTGIGGAALALAVAQGWGRRTGIGVTDVVTLVAGLACVAASRRL